MPTNNHMITGINPARMEKDVDLDVVIKLSFSRAMEPSSLTADTLILSRVNGEIVPCVISYDRERFVVTLTPEAPLLPGSEYNLFLPSGDAGVRSALLNETMGFSRTFEFVTGFAAGVGLPENLQVTTDGGFLFATWERPAQTDISQNLKYELRVSESNQEEQLVVWPGVLYSCEVTTTNLDIPKRFAEGNYYVYVRVLMGEEVGEWVHEQKYVEPSSSATTPSPTPTPVPEVNLFSFDIVEAYPENGSAHLTPEFAMLLFSKDINQETVTKETVYVIPRELPRSGQLSDMNLLTDFAYGKQIESTVSSPSGRVLRIEADFLPDKTYTVVVHKDVKSSPSAEGEMADSLGVTYATSFRTAYSRLYGDLEMIRLDMGEYGEGLTDATLYRYLNSTSNYAYQLVSRMASFDEASYANGLAPYYVHEFVRLKTVHELLLNSQLHEGGGGAVSNVSLGDLTVAREESGESQSLTSLLKQIEGRLKPLMDMMQGRNNRGYARAGFVVRGENGQAEPEFITRSEYRELGQ